MEHRGLAPPQGTGAKLMSLQFSNREEDPGKYRAVSLTILGKVIEQLIVDVIFKHVGKRRLSGVFNMNPPKENHV